MSLHVGLGTSVQEDIIAAVKEACLVVKKQLSPHRPQVIFISATPQFSSPQVLSEVKALFSNSIILGGSTCAVICRNALLNHGISVLGIFSENASFSGALCKDITDVDPYIAGQSFAEDGLRQMSDSSVAKQLVFLSDPNMIHIQPFLKGVTETVGSSLQIFGGKCTNDFLMSPTFQFYDMACHTESVAGFFAGGDWHAGTENLHGWRPLGQPRIVDDASAAVIHRINGLPAFELYSEFFEEYSRELFQENFSELSLLYPLGIYNSLIKEYGIRHPLTVTSDLSIVTQAEVPVGSEIHLMIGNKDSCRRSAIQAAQNAHRNLGGRYAKAVIIFDSICRLKAQGKSAFEEIRDVADIFGTETPIIGMFTLSETLITSEEIKTNPFIENGHSISIMAIG